METTQPAPVTTWGIPTAAPEALMEVKVSSTMTELPHTGFEPVVWALGGCLVALGAVCRRLAR